jgi:hypothetical protein
MATKKRITKTTTKLGNKRITTIIEEELNLNELVNHVVLILDDSGSMSSCYREAVRQLNNNLRNIKEQALSRKQRTTVSLYLFGNRVKRVCFQVPVEQLQELDANDFASGGSTRLCDAVVEAINDGLRESDSGSKQVSYLLICATDGGENASTANSKNRIAGLIREVQNTDRWTLAFMVPRGGTAETASYGIPRDNITEWENTSRDAGRVGGMTVNSTQSYFAGRAAGMTSTKKFYDTTDLSKVGATELSKLDDVTAKFKASTVDKEMDIKAFAEDRTGRPYVIGSLYYALTKKEKVQATKEVLLVEKGKKTVYGGALVRALIGITPGQVSYVTPGNHANFDVYVKSTSVNRKLVRGTKVLIVIT